MVGIDLLVLLSANFIYSMVHDRDDRDIHRIHGDGHGVLDAHGGGESPFGDDRTHREESQSHGHIDYSPIAAGNHHIDMHYSLGCRLVLSSTLSFQHSPD
jgi:hypothetical protein